MQENNPTKKEHYIPQFYLKQFSPDGKRIYQYDVISQKQTSDPVPTKSICYEKNLYELKDDSGNIKYSNTIEKVLSVYEGEFAEIFRSIISKAQIKSNFYTNSFLTQEEKKLLIDFISTMVLRKPKCIKAAQDAAIESCENKLTEIDAGNLALLLCLPKRKNFDTEERSIFNNFKLLLNNMNFQICYTKEEVLLTSDNPVILRGDNKFQKLYKIIMPLSPQIALYMSSIANTCKSRNELIKLTSLNVRCINSAIVTRCDRWIYSKKPFTDKQIRMITKERKLSKLC